MEKRAQSSPVQALEGLIFLVLGILLAARVDVLVKSIPAYWMDVGIVSLLVISWFIWLWKRGNWAYVRVSAIVATAVLVVFLAFAFAAESGQPVPTSGDGSIVVIFSGRTMGG